MPQAGIGATYKNKTLCLPLAKCDKAIEECERKYQNNSNYVIEQSSYLKSEMEENKRSHERHLCKIQDKFSICATKMWQAPAILIRLYP
jgi:hypothetical protein